MSQTKYLLPPSIFYQPSSCIPHFHCLIFYQFSISIGFLVFTPYVESVTKFYWFKPPKSSHICLSTSLHVSTIIVLVLSFIFSYVGYCNGEFNCLSSQLSQIHSSPAPRVILLNGVDHVILLFWKCLELSIVYSVKSTQLGITFWGQYTLDPNQFSRCTSHHSLHVP